jgi:ADP-ribose pyrophosphatase YjhB (NUDIX family)
VSGVPAFLQWARGLQAIAQSGLAWDPGVYDRERYEQVRRIAAEMLAHANGGNPDHVEALLADESGQATPKLDARGVVLRNDEILLVQERDGAGWSLPGGWVDVGESPSEAVTREVLEESGYRVRPTKLLGLYDRDRRGYPPHPWHIWKVIFLCELENAEQGPLGSETTAASFFAPDLLPGDLRFSRTTADEVKRCFEQSGHPEWPAEFD